MHVDTLGRYPNSSAPPYVIAQVLLYGEAVL